MKRRFVRVWVPLCCIAAALFCGCSQKGRLIPRDKLSEIYADIFIADQWLRDNHDLKKKADTTLFYEPIFERYGYTSKDYTASVDKYISKPDQFSKVLKKSATILRSRAEKAKKYKALKEKADAENAMFRRGYERKDFNFPIQLDSSGFALMPRCGSPVEENPLRPGRIRQFPGKEDHGDLPAQEGPVEENPLEDI